MSTRNEIRALLREHELVLKRSFGQSFLVDDAALAGIAETATNDDPDTVVEIGTGLGTLTRALASRAKRVITIERDRTLIPVLKEIFREHSNVEIVEGDALKVDFGALATRPAIAGNLPYSITSPLLLALLAQKKTIGPTTVMIQREVAERLLSPPNTRDYGSLTVLFRLHANIERAFDVPPESFLPAPKVHSTVLRLNWLDDMRFPVEDPAHLERVVRAAFSLRRKTLRNSLSTAFDKAVIEQAAKEANIALERRAETLTLEEFASLACRLPRASLSSPAEPSDH